MPGTDRNTPKFGTANDMVDDGASSILALMGGDSDDDRNTAVESEADASEAGDEPEDRPEESEASDDQDEDTAEAEVVEESAKPITLTLDDGSEITLDEARKGYLRQSDYTRKAQEVAAQRQDYQTRFAQLSQQSQALQQQYDATIAVLQASLPQRPPPELMESDFFEYLRQDRAYSEKVGHLQRLMQEKQAVQAQTEAKAQEERAKQAQIEASRLKETVPELFDVQKGPALQMELVETMKDYGISVDEVRQTTDHRLLRLAVDAMKWRKLQASKPATAAKVKAAPPVQKPGTRATPQARAQAAHRADFDRLRKTGKESDAAKVIERFLK